MTQSVQFLFFGVFYPVFKQSLGGNYIKCLPLTQVGSCQLLSQGAISTVYALG